VSRKNEGAAAEGVRQDDLRSGVDVALRNLRHALGILQVPALRRGPGLEPELLEFGAPGAVRQNAARGRYQLGRVAISFGIYVKNFQKSIKMELTWVG